MCKKVKNRVPSCWRSYKETKMRPAPDLLAVLNVVEQAEYLQEEVEDAAEVGG